MNEKWSKSYKKSIDCNNPKGFSQKAHCAGRKKRQQGESIMSKPVNEQQLKEVELFLEKNIPTNPSKWSYYKSQAKKKFDVYPSAYANAWAAKQYKAAGGGWKTKKESIDEFQRDRQLRDPKKEMLIVKDGKVIVINKKDFDKYKRKGWIVAEGLDEKKNIKVTFRSKAAKQKYMKKQSLQPNSKEIVNQTDTSLTLTPDMKDYVSKKSHDDLIYQVESVVNEAKSVTLITYGGREIKYKNSDIDNFIRNLDLNAEDLPGLIYKASMRNPNIIDTRAKSYDKKKEAILKLLKKIKSHSGDVIIDLDSKNPSFKHTVRFGLPESVVNEAKEPEVISQLRSIVKDQQNKKIKDPVSGKTMRVDLYSASAVTQVYDALGKSNKDKFGKLSLPKMVNVAFKVIK